MAGATFTVTTTNDVVDATDGQLSLREAVTQAQNGDTITFASGLNGQQVDIQNGPITLTKSLTFDGDLDNDGQADVAIDATGGQTLNQRASLLLTSSNLEVNVVGIKFTDGIVVVRGQSNTLNIDDSEFTSQTDQIHIRGADFTLNIDDTEMSGSEGNAIVDRSGQGFASTGGGTITFTDSSITDSRWGIRADGSVFPTIVTDIVIKDSVFEDIGKVDSILALNGAIFKQSAGSISVEGSTFRNNLGKEGGAIHNEQGSLTVKGSTFINNTAQEEGGAIALLPSGRNGFGGQLNSINVIEDSTFEGNKASRGGAVYTASQSNASLTIDDSVFKENKAIFDEDGPRRSFFDGSGGAIYDDATDGSWSSLTITDTLFQQNSADNRGGALHVQHGGGPSDPEFAKTTVERSTFESNSADNLGGAISNLNGTLDLINSTLIRNNAGDEAGAIYNQSIAWGGALEWLGRPDEDLRRQQTAEVNVKHSTIVQNTTTSGETGGIFARHDQNGGGDPSVNDPRSSVELFNSILMANVGSGNAEGVGTFTFQGRSVTGPGIEGGTGNSVVSNTVGSVFRDIDGNGNVQLDPNQGKTPVAMLKTGSIAFDVGTATDPSITTDQRDQPFQRTSGSAPDAGAVEEQAGITVEVVSAKDGSPLQGAIIDLVDSNGSSTIGNTGVNGKVSFSVPAGNYTASVVLGQQVADGLVIVRESDGSPDNQIVFSPSSGFVSGKFELAEADYGDAVDFFPGTGPGEYQTDRDNNGATHVFINDDAPYLGSVRPDAEKFAQGTGLAGGDDAVGVDDEDAISDTINLFEGYSETITISGHNPSAQVAYVRAWVDYNRDGVFAPGEQVLDDTVGALDTFFTKQIALTGPQMVYGESVMRIRISNDSAGMTDGLGIALGGEVEDHKIVFYEALDYGDLPGEAEDGFFGFPTRLADDGPRHVIGGSTEFGGNISIGAVEGDPEIDGQPTLNADGDDSNPGGLNNDEDGLAAATQVFAGLGGITVEVDVRNNSNSSATLAGWLDWDGDGILDASERASTVVQPGDLVAPLFFAGAPRDASGPAFLRLRMAFDANEVADPTGRASSGEVEDHVVVIKPTKFVGTPRPDNITGNDPQDDDITGLGRADTINALGGDDVIDGGGGSDVINAGAGDDSVLGNRGNDTIDAGSENDTVKGGAGLDSIIAGDGDDSVEGGMDADTIEGGNGKDTLKGNEGKDSIVGGANNDSIRGGSNDDTLEGGDGKDKLRGDDGSDSLVGGAQNDTLDGDAGGDTLEGGNGNDVLRGGAGNDSLSGDAGSDTLNGGTGKDTVSGGTGSDVFEVTQAFQFLDIKDFEDTTGAEAVADGLDVIELSFGATFNGGVALTFDQLHFRQNGADTVIKFDLNRDGTPDPNVDIDNDGTPENPSIVVRNAATSDFQAVDFIFS